MRKGNEAREAGQYPTAASHYSQVLEMEPGNSEAYLSRAQVHCLQDNHESALSDIDTALRLDSKNVEVYTIMYDTHTQTCYLHMSVYFNTCMDS